MATQPNLNLNQFVPQAVVGLQALGIGSPAIVRQVMISPNQATSLVSGQAVKIDTSVQTNGIPNVIACAANAYADGYILFDIEAAGGSAAPLSALTVCQMLVQGALWMLVDGTTINAGTVVEDTADAGGVEPLGTTGGSYPRGIALDYGASGTLIRVDLQPAVTKVVQAAS